MPFCPKCGKGIPTDTGFCPSCGCSLEENFVNETAYSTQMACPPVAPAQYSDGGAARRQQLLDNFYLRLKWELKAWRIYARVWFIFGAVFAGLSLLLFLSGLFLDMPEAFAMYYMAFIYSFVSSLYIAEGVICAILKNKVTKYMDGLYYDCSPAVTRGESIGMIVFNALFNQVALVFYLINFITIKEHREEFEEINRLQFAARNNDTYNQ